MGEEEERTIRADPVNLRLTAMFSTAPLARPGGTP